MLVLQRAWGVSFVYKVEIQEVPASASETSTALHHLPAPCWASLHVSLASQTWQASAQLQKYWCLGLELAHCGPLWPAEPLTASLASLASLLLRHGFSL